MEITTELSLLLLITAFKTLFTFYRYKNSAREAADVLPNWGGGWSFLSQQPGGPKDAVSGWGALFNPDVYL